MRFENVPYFYLNFFVHLQRREFYLSQTFATRRSHIYSPHKIMFIDARTLPENTFIECDICIIGAGAAGITLARELIDQPLQVCLLESGGLEFDEVTQSLYAGENVGEPYYSLAEARARYLGGSTNFWGGWSRPLDDIDFQERPWMPYSGWAFNKAQLDPYYDRAQTACNLGAYKYDFADWEDALKQRQLLPVPTSGDSLVTQVWQTIPSTHLRFGEAYREQIEQARNIDTYLHANVVEIVTNDTACSVTKLRVTNNAGKEFWIAAKVFVLASGGIENPRLLLNSRQVQNTGLGNQHDLVGRFFMEHPILNSGKVQFPHYTNLYSRKDVPVDGALLSTGLGLSSQVQEREQLLNFTIRFNSFLPEGLEALKRLSFRLQQTKNPDALQTILKDHRKIPQTSVMEDVATVVGNLDAVIAKAYTKFFSKKLNALKAANICSTRLISEQAPNPDSRITLSSDRDKLGLNKVKLDWRLSEIDRYTMQRSQQIIASELNGFAQNELTDNNIAWQSLRGSYHHMGTTRMSTNPRLGVVNEHCQVHGINNLYIAGSSVFPTSGLSNPTLTIIALSIRLGDRLKTRLGGSVGYVSNFVTIP